MFLSPPTAARDTAVGGLGCGYGAPSIDFFCIIVTPRSLEVFRFQVWRYGAARRRKAGTCLLHMHGAGRCEVLGVTGLCGVASLLPLRTSFELPLCHSSTLVRVAVVLLLLSLQLLRGLRL